MSLVEGVSEGFNNASESKVNDEDSSDDELDFSSTNNEIGNTEKRFYFYEFGVHPVPLQDILNDLTKLKATYNATRTLRGKTTVKFDSTVDIEDVNYVQPTTKTFNIKDFQTKQLSKKHDSSLARFHRYPDPWDSSFEPSGELKKKLYRIPCRDPSGKVIRNLGRDDPKGVRPWKAVEVDRILPEATFDSCSETFRVQVMKHMDEVIEKVEKEYSKAPQATQAQSNLKALLGADLNNLKTRRIRLKEDLAKAEATSQPPSRHNVHK